MAKMDTATRAMVAGESPARTASSSHLRDLKQRGWANG